ncbi:MAG: hypothetical protein GY945_12010, partial [Rhodobacteraceae bacterium]|nr:hypothetical protein [Paracoccaceae bacterium]
ADGILAVGTLRIEALFAAQPRMPQRVLRYEHRDGWLRGLSISLTAEGELTLEMRQGDAVSCARLNITVPPIETRLRISYSWNAPGRHAVLTVENLDQELLHQAEFSAPLPLPLGDAREIIRNSPATRIGRDTRFIALSDKVEPVGLTLGVAKGTPVETPSGPQFIERLRLGDEVVTISGAVLPVRWIIKREVPLLGRFRPVRLRAPYFGLTRDILTAPDHRVMVTGADAEYLFGETSVLVEARHLVDGKSVRRESPARTTLWYYHVLLDGHECMKYAGLWGESLFVGSIGRCVDMIGTTALSEMPFAAIPRHTRFALPILSGLEARTLAMSLSA